jgi:hypothetical protein
MTCLLHGNELISFCQPVVDEGPSRVPGRPPLFNLLALLYYWVFVYSVEKKALLCLLLDTISP